MHIAQGYGDPLKGCLQLELVLKGLNRRRPRSQDSRLPIMPFVLLRIMSVLDKDPHKYDNILLWAACCLGFFAFLRSAEFTVSSSWQFDPTCHLTPQDIAVDNVQQPAVMKIRIKASKTDQMKIGIDLYVGRTDNAICPIAAVLAYLAVRGQARVLCLSWRMAAHLHRSCWFNSSVPLYLKPVLTAPDTQGIRSG